MAFDAGIQPTEFNLNSTTTIKYVEPTDWEKVQIFLSDTQNVAKYILVPSFCILIGACIIIYTVHICRKYYRTRKRLKRYEMKLKMIEEQKMGHDKDDLIAHDVTGAYFSFNEATVKPKSGDKPLVYLGDQEQADRPSSRKSTVEERFQQREVMTPPKKLLSAPVSTNRAATQTTKKGKNMTTFSTRCTCESTTLHRPGCKHFKLPDISSVNGPLNVNDVNVAMREALDKVMKYEQELKNNPEMQSILLKYRQRKEHDKQRKVAHHIDRGDWQNVPIARLLERKKVQRVTPSRMSSTTNGSRTLRMA